MLFIGYSLSPSGLIIAMDIFKTVSGLTRLKTFRFCEPSILVSLVLEFSRSKQRFFANFGKH